MQPRLAALAAEEWGRGGMVKGAARLVLVAVGLAVLLFVVVGVGVGVTVDICVAVALVVVVIVLVSLGGMRIVLGGGRGMMGVAVARSGS